MESLRHRRGGALPSVLGRVGVVAGWYGVAVADCAVGSVYDDFASAVVSEDLACPVDGVALCGCGVAHSIRSGFADGPSVSVGCDVAFVAWHCHPLVAVRVVGFFTLCLSPHGRIGFPSAVGVGSAVTEFTDSGIVSGEAMGLFLADAVDGWPAGESPVCRVFKAHGARRPMIEEL